jgi:hypothetical protein
LKYPGLVSWKTFFCTSWEKNILASSSLNSPVSATALMSEFSSTGSSDDPASSLYFWKMISSLLSSLTLFINSGI